MHAFTIGVLLVLGYCLSNVAPQQYAPDWESIDSRPIPDWYDEVKVGIFIHWGVYSVPGVRSEWFWEMWKREQCDYGCDEIVDYVHKNLKPDFGYQEFGRQFTAEFFKPEDWADLFEKSGAKYVVLTSKHHEGYTLWPSPYSFSWNSQEVGPHRDLVGDLTKAIRENTTLRMGYYYSLYEWFNPMWMRDRDGGFNSTEYVDIKFTPEITDLVNRYHPDIVWTDGEWEAHSSYWKSEQFLAWLFNDSPVRDRVVINDRWGGDTRGVHGGFWTGGDRFNPGVVQPHKFENCFTLDLVSWGHRRNAKIDEYMTPEQLMQILIETISCGGNALVNVGPTRDGMIPPIQQERLLQMGQWLGVNGEAIYNSIPWKYQNDTLTPGVWYTSNKDQTKVYALLTFWPGESVQLGAIEVVVGMTVEMLGTDGPVTWTESEQGITVTTPRPDKNASKWAWTIVITYPFPQTAAACLVF